MNLIQITKQPKRYGIAVSAFYVVYRQIGIFHLCDLPGIFGFAADFQNDLLIHQKITLMVVVHLMVCQKLRNQKALPYGA